MTLKYRNDYFDFVDFFNLVKDSCPTISQEDLFLELVYTIYLNADHSTKSIKDDIGDIKRKKKAFNTKVINLFSQDLIADIAKQYKSPLLDSYIIQQELLIDKLMFLISKDKLFFSQNDIHELNTHKSDPGYVLAYIMFITVKKSTEAKNYKHESEYNPFSDYKMPAVLSANTTPSNSSNIHSRMASLSEYQLNNLELIKRNQYNNELLSKGVELFQNYYNNGEKEFSLNGFEEIGRDNHYIEATHIKASNSNRSLSEFYDTCNNILLIGDGGIGKTTFLHSCLKKYNKEAAQNSIPIYIRLSNCSTATDHRNIILDEIIKSMRLGLNGEFLESHRDILDEFRKDNTSFPEYTLLLDGFNEITPIDFGEIRKSVSNEINSFIKMPNVRVILTSRDSDFFTLDYEQFTVIKASGIEKDDVFNYLEDKVDKKTFTSIKRNPEFVKCLQIPLFLLMFVSNNNKKINGPLSRGSILYNYFNSTNSFYNEKTNVSEKADQKFVLLINIILDFVLPDIGFFMEDNNLFSISDYDFDEILDSCFEDAKLFLGTHSSLYKHYSLSTGSLKRAIKLAENEDREDILLILRDFLSVITIDSNGKYYFNHQYIRDYFSSIFILRSMTYAIDVNNPVKSFYFFTERLKQHDEWNDDRLKMLSEILPLFSNDISNPHFLKSFLDLCRNSTNLPNKIHNSIVGDILPNLIYIISKINNGNLYNFDFSNLVLSNCHLANKNFYNPIDSVHSSFNNSIINNTTFALDEHSAPVKKWKISNDGLSIYSISQNYEFKIWRITSRRCVLTVQLPRISSSNLTVFDMDYFIHDHDAFVSIAYYDCNSMHLAECATFNITTRTYTSYHISEEYEQNGNFIFWGYNNFANQLWAITDTGMLLMYNPGDDITNDSKYISQNLLSRLTKHYLTPHVLQFEINGKTKWIQFIDKSRMLYTESDISCNFFHALDNQLYRGSDDYDAVLVDNNTIFTCLDELGTAHCRHINIFIYDTELHELHDLQLDEYESVTSLVLPKTLSDDVLSENIAVSKDFKKIVLHNYNDLYMYECDSNTFKFQKVGKLPDYRGSFSLTFCHDDSNLLTCFDEARVLHYDLKNREKISQYAIGLSYFTNKTVCNGKYIVRELTSSVSGTFGIENFYTESENSLSLSIDDIILDCFSSEHYVYVLFHNGTVAWLDKYDLSLISCFNYCPDQHVINYDYCAETNSLCIICSNNHSFLLDVENKIVNIDLSTHKSVESISNLGNYRIAKFIFAGKYIIAFVDDHMILLDSSQMTILDDIIALEKHLYEKPIEVFSIDDKFHILYSKNYDYGSKHYFGTVITYTVENNKFKYVETSYIPALKYDKNISDLYIRQFPIRQICSTSLCMVKSIEKNNKTISYLYENPLINVTGYSETPEHKRSLSEWNIVYLDFNTKKYDDEFSFDIRENDRKVLNSPSDTSLVYFENKRIFLESINQDELPSKIEKQLFTIDFESRMIYIINKEKTCIEVYDIDHKTLVQSKKLYPSVLTCNCSFSNCQGKNYLPEYFQI